MGGFAPLGGGGAAGTGGIRAMGGGGGFGSNYQAPPPLIPHQPLSGQKRGYPFIGRGSSPGEIFVFSLGLFQACGWLFGLTLYCSLP